MDRPIDGYPGNLFAQKVTILAGTSVSELIATQGKAMVAIEMSSGWDAANIGVQACLSGNPNYLKTCYDSGGNREQAVVAASHFIIFPTTDAIFGPFIALASISAADGSAVNQSADRTLNLLFRTFVS